MLTHALLEMQQHHRYRPDKQNPLFLFGGIPQYDGVQGQQQCGEQNAVADEGVDIAGVDVKIHLMSLAEGGAFDAHHLDGLPEELQMILFKGGFAHQQTAVQHFIQLLQQCIFRVVEIMQKDADGKGNRKANGGEEPDGLGGKPDPVIFDDYNVCCKYKQSQIKA